ncbi:hypothetical protein C7999DRAFT_27258 [Corynascus novoguineensis]|uniref:Uncharacterized protein n=1 Tax=Corynascus novoguineensis TaxID=1126955 RepID=A0AAN7HV73_9PEZI|nr:hypothetical protein C7999DRAFT_27258 [Corynascus novoguineensis]
MRYLMHKRLKSPAPLEIPERRQVGDVEAIFRSAGEQQQQQQQQQQHYQRQSQYYPARGSDSEL